ncbi:MAG: hypothetical protein KGN77_00905 [Xanthomonadaceae bacterium]|nr:hypothetical protein [Xanthomonadaceae bacterium]MDE1964041.1 hypothetical protein [Xanthomonadaceae bacterium]
MNRKPNRNLTSYRAIPCALVVAGIGMFAGSVNAQWIVHDPGNAVINESGFASQLAKTIEQYAMQAQQYATQLQQYQNMLTSIESLGTGISLFPKTMQRMSDAQIQKLVEQACPGPALGTGVIGAVTSTLEYEASLNKPITESQQVICQQIVMLQADEYNVTVDAMGQLAVQASTVQKLSKVVNSISSMGKAASATSQTEQYLSQLQTAAETWQKQIQADEAVIQTLNRQQGILARVALTGSSTVLGNVVQATALKVAFTINN